MREGVGDLSRRPPGAVWTSELWYGTPTPSYLIAGHRLSCHLIPDTAPPRHSQWEMHSGSWITCATDGLAQERTTLPDPQSGSHKEWRETDFSPFQPPRVKRSLAVRKAPFLRFHGFAPAQGKTPFPGVGLPAPPSGVMSIVSMTTPGYVGFSSRAEMPHGE